jgi:hypothetical protein
MVLQTQKVDETVLIGVSEHQRWYAWENLQPPGPSKLHVIGEVAVPNPGVEASLVEKYPQGFNPTILLLELILVQRPGIWAQVVVNKQVHFEKLTQGNHYKYKLVEVFSGGDAQPIVAIPVEEVH